MPPATFDEFLPAFFNLFTQSYAGRTDFLDYLAHRSDAQGRGDEATIVDSVIVGPLLGLLGFETTERIYNQQKAGDRPDFAPRDEVFGTCFLVEDKNTSLELDCDMTHPDGHLRQLSRYVQASGRQSGWLTNGRRFTAWRFDGPEAAPVKLIDLDVTAAVAAWKANATPEGLPDEARHALRDLFDTFRKTAFAEPARLEKLIAVDEETWRAQALPLGGAAGAGNENILVDALKSLVKQLSADARRTLTEHLANYAEYEERARFLADDRKERAADKLREQRALVAQQLTTLKPVAGLTDDEAAQADTLLTALEKDARAFPNPVALQDAVLAILDGALARKYAGNARAVRRGLSPNERGALENRIAVFAETAFGYHQRLAALRQRYRESGAVHDNYLVWASLVEETMLGDLSEEQRRDEFALQAAYVVFIRLLLIRVCEDKGVFPQRFLTDGGFAHWQEDIERYLKFANGNPYEPLLDMAYKNAQNIYAHFFTGRELFNWYTLDRQRLILTLHELARFDFAGVDADIVGEVYRSYLERPEKKKRGQYYTPPEIVEYILDNVGYVSGPAIIGSNKRLLDPACGSGKFLVVAAKRLVEAFPKDPNGAISDPAAVLEQVRNSLFGFDLNPFACYLAEVNLLIQVLPLIKAAYEQAKASGNATLARPPQLSRFHVYNVDALAKPSRTYFYAQGGTLMADERDEVEKIKDRAPGTPYANGFAFIVANPPYGAKLTPAYKAALKEDYADVFRGQPDTYVFFYRLALSLLAKNGRLGFITPNTFLMGTNTSTLRAALLGMGRIEQIVDLPQGIWDDATVDCVLLFLRREEDQEKRRAQTVTVNLLNLRDGLDKLAARGWQRTLAQPQSIWLDSPANEMNARLDTLLEKIEAACAVSSTRGNGGDAVARRLGDVTDSSMGIKPFEHEAERLSSAYIEPKRNVPSGEPEWKPYLDGSSFVGRYELRWNPDRPHIKYGNWLSRPRDANFFEQPKIVIVRFRNKALKRRLIATYDEAKFYVRDNSSLIISSDRNFLLKYLLALVNSATLNFWYASRNDQVSINPSLFRSLPIFPADAATQAELAGKVDELLAKHAELGRLRDDGHTIHHKRDGTAEIAVPYDKLLHELQTEDAAYPTLSLFQAQAAGRLTVHAPGGQSATLSGNVYVPARFPASLVLRHNRLWLDVPNDDLRRYLQGYLSRPQWQNQTYDAIKNQAVLPEDDDALAAFFAAEAERLARIQILLADAAAHDAAIDEKVLDLYGITDPADRRRILGSAPPRLTDDEEATLTPQTEEDDSPQTA